MVDLFFYKELDKAVGADEEEDVKEEGGDKPAPAEKRGAWDHQGEDVEEGGDWEQ